jgi:hypothetical protein
LFDGLEKVGIEALADFFLRLFGIYGYDSTATTTGQE